LLLARRDAVLGSGKTAVAAEVRTAKSWWALLGEDLAWACMACFGWSAGAYLMRRATLTPSFTAAASINNAAAAVFSPDPSLYSAPNSRDRGRELQSRDRLRITGGKG
jgi:hypothetical protein